MSARQTTLNLWVRTEKSTIQRPIAPAANWIQTNQTNALTANRNGQDDVIALDDIDDEAFLAMAIEASKMEFEREQQKRKNFENVKIYEAVDLPSTSCSASRNENYVGFDEDAGKLWIYPTNFPKRNYQFEIIQKALFYNTLVTLPTGLGKTFIAAVVMYNFYRWYPTGKIVFMAPTKPLVSQQMEACYNIMGIPQEDMTEMTGNIAPANRKKLWDAKRVFFLTPQVINNDLRKDPPLFPAESVKCLVIDEAHKATGDHAYCQVVRQLLRQTKQFRILALSATPGSDLNAVQNVLSNLLIAHMELRDEDSPEIKKYTHTRNIECIVVPVTGDLAMLRDKYEQVLQSSLDLLIQKRLFRPISVQSVSLTSLLGAREQFRQHPPAGFPPALRGLAEGAFANAIGLLHGYVLLSNMGMKSLYNYFQGKLGEEKSTIIRRELNRNSNLREIFDFLRDRFAPEEAARQERLRFPSENESFFDRSHAAALFNTQQVTDSAASSHPKLVKLVEILLDHFKEHGGKNTRVMVFAQYRDCVEEITELLNKRKPLIRPMKFVGQTASRGTTKGITQKEQLEVVKKFKEGGYNTLVSTSVGEEGLDIGEVDLIVCYDATFSPVRSVQRMGRTGRKRAGRIIMLVTEGKEQNVFNSSEYSKKRVHKAILKNKSFLLYQDNRRMVPVGLTPICVQMHMTHQKPYENLALRKRVENQSAAVPAIKRFTGSLSEKELNEWERDFKIRDPELNIKPLGERKPLRVIHAARPKQARLNTWTISVLNENATRQDRPQRSILVAPSSIRKTFVKLAKMCQSGASSFPEVSLDVSLTTDIKELCCQRPPTVRLKRQLKKSRKAQPKQKRRRKALAAPSAVSDSCQVVAQFNATDFHTTANGEQLNLAEIFPITASGEKAASRHFGFSEPATRFEIPTLKARAILKAMEEEGGELE